MTALHNSFEATIIAKASALQKTIVLPEAEYSERVLAAGLECAEKGIVKVILLAKTSNLNKYDNGDSIKVIDITSSELIPTLANALYEKRKEKGVTLEDAQKLVANELYFGTMLVELGYADGMTAGAENSTSDVLRPALQIIKGKVAGGLVSSVMFLVKDENVITMSDCALNLDPSASELVQITKQTALSVKKYVGVDPNIALLSYSTNGSGKGDSAQKVRDAVQLLRKEKLDFSYDGEMQVDAALDSATRKLKFKDCKLNNVANTFIFPNLDSGNIGYKLVSKLGGYKAIGPLIQGLRRPVNDISRGANKDEIVLIIAATAIEGENK